MQFVDTHKKNITPYQFILSNKQEIDFCTPEIDEGGDLRNGEPDMIQDRGKNIHIVENF